jgi:hypothetical protein
MQLAGAFTNLVFELLIEAEKIARQDSAFEIGVNASE